MGELIYIEMSGLYQTCSVCHLFPRRAGLICIVPLSIPERMKVCPYSTGVTMFWTYSVSNGICHRSLPLSAAKPAMDFCVWVTSWLVPSISPIIGEAYPGPSPFQLHLTWPLPLSKSVSAPESDPPTCAITRPFQTIGDVAVPKSGDVVLNCLENSLRHRSFPVAAS